MTIITASRRLAVVASALLLFAESSPTGAADPLRVAGLPVT